MITPPPIDLIADLVLDGVEIDAAVTRMIRSGHPPAELIGLADLRDVVTWRRSAIDRVLSIDPGLTTVAELIKDAVRLEFRVLFADPDDLARFEEIELQDIAGHGGAISYHALTRRAWRSAEAKSIFAEARSTIERAVHRPITDRAMKRMIEVDSATLRRSADAVECAASLLDGADRHLAEPVAASDSSELGPIVSMIIDPAPAEVTVDRLVDELAWRRSAQHRFLSILDESTQRRLSDAWRMMADRLPRLRTAVADLHRQLDALRPSRDIVRRYEQLAGYLIADLLDPIAETAELDRLEQALAQDYPGAALDDIDEESVGRLLGGRRRQQLSELRRLVRTLTADGDPAPQVRRRLPRIASRRALCPAIRRRLAVPADEVEPPGTVLLIIDRAAAEADWASVRAAALAVPPLVRRFRQPYSVDVLVVDGGGEIRRIGPATIADLRPDPSAVLHPLQPARLAGAIQRRAAGAAAGPAAVLLIGAERAEHSLGTAEVRRLDRLGRTAGWTFGLVTVEASGPADRDRVTTTMRRAATALADAWTR